ncbi:MAG: 4-alpha-glucanotransferase [Tannerella sp.]|jgi:4-alpha-glucanotransferase|nr:4-alpha-glucanotransferase [Tannerella sp.]
MFVFFHINYYTIPGQRLCVCGSIPELGNGELFSAKEMEWSSNGQWTLQLDIPFSVIEFDYQYIFVDTTGERMVEPWQKKRTVHLEERQKAYYLYDYWRLEPADIVFYTSAFTKNIYAPDCINLNYEHTPDLVIKTFYPCIGKDRRLAITGNQDFLGYWNPGRVKALNCINFPEWEIVLDADKITFPLEYKYVIIDSDNRIQDWEMGGNRILNHRPTMEEHVLIVSDYPYRSAFHEKWKGVGTVIPVFSLRSEQSFGVGDMHDLKLLVDWAVQTNQCLIQILPMNDTTRTHTWTDSYPYSAISIYALHPIYISLSDLKPLNDAGKMTYFEEKRLALNKHVSVDYESVTGIKEQYLLHLFEQEGNAFFESKSFQFFFQTNKAWLMPYAAFCFYREKYQTPDFCKWESHAVYNADEIEKLCDKTGDAYTQISFVYFLQYILHSQFQSVSEYARKKGVVLKGDLPIGIHRTSVEAWTEPAYFNMDGQAGAPPDDFSAIGQNWSFPTYNWHVMEKDGYSWWKKRFQKLSDYYDCFRIDHILGFFRIWEIPIEYVEGLCGHFRPALPFSVDEINAFGLAFEKRYTVPQIHHTFLHELFGDITELVVGHYLSFVDATHLILNPFCDTQRKIENIFRHDTDEKSLRIKKGLFAIANEVLFLADPYEKNKYHPRISASQSFRFRELNEYEKNTFNQLADYFFYERHNDFWKAEALKHLSPLIASTDMLICGEDLGMIPKPVHEVMDQLHILSLELERAPKHTDKPFSDLKTLPYLSVCTTSTHDMEPLRNWWEEDEHRRQLYSHTVLHDEGDAPGICTAETVKRILSNHIQASSMLTIIPLQDWLGMSDTLKRTDVEQERINIPARPHHYWRYRMHITLEELLSANEFNQEIREMISK